ncbi:hypothetical protein LR48_Vigan07g204300 [Vigna angularis]|uniref:Uncharacterized protein n=1 Tax=Phaseolus angularis TaxID=3914 RepID=A0A0L9V0Q3_PHAAN|nr:hypothetical protein LR48_Vigan07g204300 [Vigna angularis]
MNWMKNLNSTVSRLSATAERQFSAATTVSRLSATVEHQFSAATTAGCPFGALSADDVGLDLFYELFKVLDNLGFTSFNKKRRRNTPFISRRQILDVEAPIFNF